MSLDRAHGPLGAHDGAIDHDSVDVMSEHRHCCPRPRGLGKHHPLGRRHESHGRVRPREQGAHLEQLCREGVERLECLEGGGGQAGRPHESGDAPVERQPAGDEPVERLGQREQPQRLGSRGAIDDHGVESGGDLSYLEQRENVVDARHRGDLVRGERVETAVAQQVPHQATQGGPRGIHPGTCVDLHHRQVAGRLGDAHGNAGSTPLPRRTSV